MIEFNNLSCLRCIVELLVLTADLFVVNRDFVISSGLFSYLAMLIPDICLYILLNMPLA